MDYIYDAKHGLAISAGMAQWPLQLCVCACAHTHACARTHTHTSINAQQHLQVFFLFCSLMFRSNKERLLNFICIIQLTVKLNIPPSPEMLQERNLRSIAVGRLLPLFSKLLSVQNRNFQSNWITCRCCSGQEPLSDKDIRQIASEDLDLPTQTTLTQILYHQNTLKCAYLRIK